MRVILRAHELYEKQKLGSPMASDSSLTTFTARDSASVSTAAPADIPAQVRDRNQEYSQSNLNKGNLPGSLGYEDVDVQMLVDWEIDYFKARFLKINVNLWKKYITVRQLLSQRRWRDKHRNWCQH